MPEPAYLTANRANWDDRAVAHVASPDYRVADFDDPEFLSDVVRFDAQRLGDVRGLRTVHLQCHIGTDTISLARLGAKITGVDLSPVSIDHARELAARTSAQADFVVADVYSAPAALDAGSDLDQGGGFDLVYTSIGALCWLPDIDRWAQVVAELLRPGGGLFLRDGHPMLHATNESRPDGLLTLEYPYFETEPLIWDGDGTYVQTDHKITHTTSYQWNHGLGELITALLRHGLELTLFEEHDTAPHEAIPGRMTQLGNGEWRLTDHPERLPLTFTIAATKRPRSGDGFRLPAAR
ncbi:class I SAM-dependent methyltransferase [Microlunatus parietis]|uniref:SAM-dependent methyltransferase n=1 Tax=Microlunatus parietis TaxID=682979 RepID=A0A7Y9LF77_9ACTN|nr:class I SAM-dependent methyltransferase [Microlunatus parietis]NYE74670.1 SAM-dependent methyltransferase [Microlunatus parietis]